MDVIEIKEWIKENSQVLQPPVGNKVVMENDQLLVMAVGGPNNRYDFHYNETTEFFYQLEGTLQLDVQNSGAKSTVWVKPGHMYLLPPKVPHRPVRPSNSIGLVIELKRPQGLKDGLLWYCPNCNHKLHEDYFELTNIEKDFQPRFQRFYESEALRTCSNCGTVHPST